LPKYGYSFDHIVDRLKVVGSTIKKYVDIVSGILSDYDKLDDKLFNQSISIPTCGRLQSIIDDFHEITGLPNICSVIDEYSFLYQNDQIAHTLALNDFFNRKKLYSIDLQAVLQCKQIILVCMCRSAWRCS